MFLHVFCPNSVLNSTICLNSVEIRTIFFFLASEPIGDDAPRPRLCRLKKWADFQGYGFNLHAEKGKAGHYIGVVDDDSPAETAGLKQGDKIIAVNGDNILEASHQAVVSKIKSDPGAVRLLVLDPEAEEYYRTRNIVVNDDMSNVIVLTSPDLKPGKPELSVMFSSVRL